MNICFQNKMPIPNWAENYNIFIEYFVLLNMGKCSDTSLISTLFGVNESCNARL